MYDRIEVIRKKNFGISYLRRRNILIELIISILFDKFMVMASSLMLGLINDMRQDGTYKDQEQSLVFMAM